MKRLKKSVFDVLPPEVYDRAQFEGAFIARMAADGIVFNRMKLDLGVPTPVIMGRPFLDCVPAEVSEIQIEARALNAGAKVSVQEALDEMIARKHEELRWFDSWIRTSKEKMGFGDD